jgi:hypothetical protein
MADATPTALAGAAQALLAHVVELIEGESDVLVALFSQAVADGTLRSYCGRTDRTTHEACDRPPEHDGDCSWTAQQIRRRYRQFEEQAMRVPVLTRDNRHLTQQVRQLNAELAPYRAKEEAQQPQPV